MKNNYVLILFIEKVNFFEDIEKTGDCHNTPETAHHEKCVCVGWRWEWEGGGVEEGSVVSHEYQDCEVGQWTINQNLMPFYTQGHKLTVLREPNGHFAQKATARRGHFFKVKKLIGYTLSTGVSVPGLKYE